MMRNRYIKLTSVAFVAVVIVQGTHMV